MTAVQLVPPSVLLTTPVKAVPASYTVVGVLGSIAMAETQETTPVSVQLKLPFMLLNTPPAPYPHSTFEVPANRLEGTSGSTAKATIQFAKAKRVIPELAASQFIPASVLLNAP